MLKARFVPIETWPGKPTAKRKDATFRVSYIQTLDLLETELAKLGAKEILIQAHFTHYDLRNDGWPKNTAKPSGPGVIVSFESPKGPLSFPCDTYMIYEDNLRAIGLALQALRAVDRYGVTRNNEQYRGWAQIEAPVAGGFRSADDAAAFIATQSDDDPSQVEDNALNILNDPEWRKEGYKRAAKRLHPDNHRTGNHELFVKLGQALAMLESA